MATIVGLFDEFVTAQQVVDELVKRGFRRDEISLVANASASEYAKYFQPETDPSGALAQEKPLTAGEGAGVGATVGAITGIVVGLASFAIPGVGPVIGAGPLIAGLTGGTVGVIAGAATGGIAAGLIEAGVPQEEAHLYEDSIRQGGTLLAVQSPETAMAAVKKLMQDHYAVDVVQRRTESQTDSQRANDSKRQNYAVGGITFETFEPDYRTHYSAHYADSGYLYSQMVPFYQYGYDLATDPRYATATWDEVEAAIKPGWQDLNPHGVWDNFQEAVHYGWEAVRGAR